MKTIWSAIGNYIDYQSIKFGCGPICNIPQKIDFEQEMWVYVQEKPQKLFKHGLALKQRRFVGEYGLNRKNENAS